jgi:hypothetical protein
MPRFDPKEDLIYVECGDKLNYAACWLPEQDGDLVFMGWIRKFCYKYGIKMKVSMEELGLTYPPPVVEAAPTRVTIVPCKECHEHPCTCN